MLDKAAKAIADRLAASCNITAPTYAIIDKAGEQYLAIHVGHINDIYAKHIDSIRQDTDSRSNPFGNRIFLKPEKPSSWLHSLETQLLQRLLAESLTIGKATLDSDFHRTFIPFLGGEERRVFSETNHVIFGRRGAGKSSLVLYACNQARRNGTPFSWIALQQYSGRSDLLVVPQVLYEIIDSVQSASSDEAERIRNLRSLVYKLEERGSRLTKEEINASLPVFARHFLPFVQSRGCFYLCIDDLHLLHPTLQPYFLSSIYSFSRGNSVYLKITAIENLTTLYNTTTKDGLQPPGDAQVIRLDYNLVNPKAAHDHIRDVLNGYVKYVGIPSVSSLCGKAVLERLVWVSAGVPRDALYIFSNAITKAIAAERAAVAVMDINMAAADSLTEKERYVTDDVAEDSQLVKEIIEDIKEFCLKEIKCNAFLVHIDTNDRRYHAIKKVSDLRFIHVLHPGITPEQAGEKYEAAFTRLRLLHRLPEGT